MRLAVAVSALVVLAACGTAEQTYYTPPSRTPAASLRTPSPGNVAIAPTATPDTHIGATPYPTPNDVQAARSRQRALLVCPEARREQCVNAFIVVDASPFAGLLCVEPDGDFMFQMDRRYQPFPHPGAGVWALPIFSPDEGVGVPCRSNLTAMSVAFVGGHGAATE